MKLDVKDWISKFFRKPNGDADVWATMAFMGTVGLITAQYWALAKGQTFNAQDFGIGFGALLGAAAAGLGFKTRAENGYSTSTTQSPKE